MCIKPSTRKVDGFIFPCGQCVNCLVNRKREWIARCLLETTLHKASYFLTLTMEVPREQVVGLYETYVSKYYLQCFFKRLGKRFGRKQFKYFARAEYGSLKGRAHYHVLLWAENPGITADVFRSLWRVGSVDVGDIQPDSIDYVVDYILKQSSVASNIYSSVDGRLAHPDFRLISQGIGERAVPHLQCGGLLHHEFRVLGRTYPVGRYLKVKHLGGLSLTDYYYDHGSIPIQDTPNAVLEKALYAELRSLQVGTPAYTEASTKLIQQQKALSDQRQKLKQIAYYRNINQPTKGRKHETF